MALTQYDKNNLTAAQQAGIQAATERYNNATTQAERDAAHAQAEAIRNNAGYTSDTSGAYSGAYQRTIGTTSSPDYSALITQGMARGAGSSEIESLLNQRVSKATGTPGLEQYAYDNVYDSALAYINQAKKAESAQQQAAQNEAYLKELISQYNGQNISYAQALQAQQAAQQAAVQKAVNTLESQKTDTTNQYNDLFRQLYINKMKNQKNIGQQMAAMGVNGGAAESTLLGMNAQYEDALRQGEQGRLDAIRPRSGDCRRAADRRHPECERGGGCGESADRQLRGRAPESYRQVRHAGSAAAGQRSHGRREREAVCLSDRDADTQRRQHGK